jgi:GNAT superfamily N-acetyltransferase
MDSITLEKVGPENLSECGIGCITNRRHPGYQSKVDWLQRAFADGLRFFLARDGDGQPLGFLEYVPGEFAWRPVEATGWLFVHCLWVFRRGRKVGGLGSRLIQACSAEARRQRAIGVAAVVSDGPLMAGQQVFLKNGFKSIEQRDRFQLVIHQLRKGPQPRFREIKGTDPKIPGLHLVYCAQCPINAKSAKDLSELMAERGLKLKVTVLHTAAEAQAAPSYYGVFNLMWNGRLLADHYVSKGRFKNLLHRKILEHCGALKHCHLCRSVCHTGL